VSTDTDVAVPRDRSEQRDQRGFVAVWFALLIFVLLGIAALVVDVAHGYVVGQDAQNAADAGALGGVVFLPNNATGAQSRALAVVSSNGFTNDTDTTVAASTLASSPTKLQVDVTKRVKTWFGRAIGFGTLTVHRSAIADYDQPVRMGSPANTFGNLPDCSPGSCTNSATVETPHFWFNVAGKDSRKQNGDAYQAGRCDAAADNCPSGGTNSDYDDAGYSFIVHNDIAGSSLDIEVYDAGMVHEGDHCENSQLDALVTAAGAANAARYAKGDGPYCTGDIQWDFNEDNDAATHIDGEPMTTTYSVYYDPGTPWNHDDDDLRCGPLSIPGVGQYNDDGTPVNLAGLWNANDARLRTYFRRWASVCTINGAAKGDYLLYIKGDTGRGHNRGAVRVRQNGSATSSGVRLTANGKMAIYQNEIGADTRFYLARVVPGASGRTLQLKFFDTGDASQPGTIQVLPPSDAVLQNDDGTSTPLTQFSNCSYTAPPGNSTGPPWGTFTSTETGCKVSNVSANSTPSWQGQWIEWDVPIPDKYSCTVNDETKCWVTIKFSYPDGTADTSTWSAQLDGNPVRIVK
jgi:hypothetical protein